MGQNDRIREAAEEIHGDLCGCDYMNPEDYEIEITRIMGRIEKTHKEICHVCHYLVPVYESHRCRPNQTFSCIKGAK